VVITFFYRPARVFQKNHCPAMVFMHSKKYGKIMGKSLNDRVGVLWWCKHQKKKENVGESLHCDREPRPGKLIGTAGTEGRILLKRVMCYSGRDQLQLVKFTKATLNPVQSNCVHAM
jgi:hypothetical protein